MKSQEQPIDREAGIRCCATSESHEPADATPDASRRRFLVGAITSTAASLLVGASAELAAPTQAAAQSTVTPQAALQALIDGNQRYVEGRLQSLGEDLSILKLKTAEKQEPFAAVLSCADSRVPVELVFDQSIGRLFVARVAGNFITPEITASLEYGVVVLGTKAIMVLGHGDCGAVKATIRGKEVPGQISALFAPIQPAVDAAGPNLDAAIDANAKIQAALLRESSPVIAGMIKKGKLMVAAARYDVASGKVTVLT